MKRQKSLRPIDDPRGRGKLTLIDLFCGAGGLSCGLEEAGFEAVGAVDFDKHAMATYQANHPGTLTLVRDIATVSASDFTNVLRGRELDLLAGGPSCQGYSTHGKRKEDDPRNFLFNHFVRLVGELRPKCFVMENVKGLLTFRKGHFRNLIEESFGQVGYHVVSQVLCAADYGVPQLRHRIVFIGTRLDVPLSFPEPTHSQGSNLFGLNRYVTVGEAIGDLPLLGTTLEPDFSVYAAPPTCDYQRYARAYSRANRITLHQANGVSKQAMAVITMLKEGQGLRSIPPKKLPDRFKRMRTIADGSLRKDCTTLYHRLSRSAPAYTITCYFRNVASGAFTHPIENRSLSYREAARLMSFRDNYDFVGAMLPRQIGNAVPPLLAKAIGRHVALLIKTASPVRGRAARLKPVITR